MRWKSDWLEEKRLEFVVSGFECYGGCFLPIASRGGGWD